jgi:hypothetical protein
LARALLVGCGCAARGAGALLAERGWAVRGTSRSGEGRAAIEAAGFEAAAADPDRVGSVVELLGDVTVLAWVLGAVAEPAGRELNGERLASLLEKLVDTPVRGFVFEAPASGAGLEPVQDAAVRWRIPTEVVACDRGDANRWAADVADAVERSVGLG